MTLTRRARLGLGLVAVLVAGATSALIAARSRAGPTEPFSVTETTVADQATGLHWQRRPPAEPVTFQAANSYCEGLELDGEDDWRLPSMKELQTIVADTRVDPAIDPTLFPDTPSESFWSSSTWTGTTELIWVVLFKTGYTNYDRADFNYRTRCVR